MNLPANNSPAPDGRAGDDTAEPSGLKLNSAESPTAPIFVTGQDLLDHWSAHKPSFVAVAIYQQFCQRVTATQISPGLN